jgi:hypothetical protein
MDAVKVLTRAKQRRTSGLSFLTPSCLNATFLERTRQQKILPSDQPITFLTNEREGWKKVRSTAQSNDLFKQQCFPVIDGLEPR